LSNSTVIPKEKLTAYQRWELHSFDQLEDQAQPHARGPASAAADEAAKVRNVHQLAYEAGRADGLREAAAMAAVDAQGFAALIESLRRQHLETSHLLADEILGVALEIARQMINQSLAARPEGVLTVVQEALSRVLQPAAQATITLNPADAALVQSHLGETLAAGGWRISEDANLARGGCRLHTLASELDATIATRWHRIVTALGQETPWLA
jgi:flagellar assembly protein FliH